MSTHPSPSLPSSSLPSPVSMAIVRKPPKTTYGRRQLSSPSEADRSSTTLVDIDLSPFTKLSGKDIVPDEIQASFSSQETRVCEDSNDGDDREDSPRNDKSTWKHKLQELDNDDFGQTNARLRSTLHDTDGAVRRGRASAKVISTAAEEGAEDDTGTSKEFQFPWRDKLKQIDVDFAAKDSLSDTRIYAIPEAPISESMPCQAESSKHRQLPSLTNQTTTPVDLDNLHSDGESFACSPTRSRSRTRGTRSKPVEQSREASPISELDDKHKPKTKISKGKEKKDKAKRPTKKIIEDTRREQARIDAGRNISFPRAQEPRKYNISELANRLQADAVEVAKPSLQRKSSFDPIQRWSSPIGGVTAPPHASVAIRVSSKKSVLTSRTSFSPDLGTSTSGGLLVTISDDEVFPELGDIIKEGEQKREKEEMHRRLAEHKQRILEQQKAGKVSNGEDDDDLEVLKGVEVRGEQNARSKTGTSASGSRNRFPGKKKGGREQEQLNLFLLKQAEQMSAHTIRKKEEDWTKTGGKVSSGVMDDKSSHRETWLDKLGKKAAEPDGNEGDVEGSDDEWTPDDPTAASDAGGDENSYMLQEEDLEKSKGHDSDLDTDENNAPILARSGIGCPRNLNVVDSDDEGNIIVPDTSSFQLSQPVRLSMSPFGDAVENETDKENDMDLMFDMSEDKENTLIRGRPAGARLPLRSRSGSPLGRRGTPSIPLLDTRANKGVDERLPFKELRRDDDSNSEWLASGARLRKGSAASDVSCGSSPLLAPVFGANGDSDREGSPKPAALQGGFSQLFGSGSVPQGRTLSFGSPSKSTAEKSGLDGLRKFDDPAELSLTLDGGLQPALEVSDAFRRKADSIFEQEQAYLFEAANVAKSRAKPQLYIDENGFLTQNRPDSTNPEIYRPPATQASPQGLLTQTQRQPLGTISVLESSQISPDNFDSGGPKRRLKRYTSTSPIRKSGYQSSPSPTLVRRPLDAFDALRKGAADDKAKKQKNKYILPLDKSEFVQAEAQESDEDDGFGLAKKGDETEEEGSDAENDKPLEGLVNDVEMDAATEAKEMVVEKFKEQLEADDASLEKYHRDAAEGKFRTKRRNRGVDFEDSGSELDDDDARELRRRMAKKRKIEGDSLGELAKNEDTMPFVQAYENGLKEDDMLPILAEHEDVSMGDGDDDDENTEVLEPISMHEIYTRVRQKAREKSVERFDPSNTAWLDDGDDDEDNIRVRTVSHRTVARHRGEGSATVDPDQLRFEKRNEGQEVNDRLNTWAKANSRNQSSGYAPTGGSVTARPKAAPTKQKAGFTGTIAAKSERQKSLGSGGSMLSAIPNKRDKFES